MDHKIKEEKRMRSLNQSKRKDGPGKKKKERIKKLLMFFRERINATR
jgi:hypothetical protein